jgi:hypothetical protein
VQFVRSSPAHSCLRLTLGTVTAYGLRRHRRASLNGVCHVGSIGSSLRPRRLAASNRRDWVPWVRKEPQIAEPKEANMATTEMTVKIQPNDTGNPGKRADAELHFTTGPLEGLKLTGFSVWERRGGTGRKVTFPARQYAVNGERRIFALLRPIVNKTEQNAVRDRILEAYAEYEEAVATASA